MQKKIWGNRRTITSGYEIFAHKIEFADLFYEHKKMNEEYHVYEKMAILATEVVLDRGTLKESSEAETMSFFKDPGNNSKSSEKRSEYFKTWWETRLDGNPLSMINRKRKIQEEERKFLILHHLLKLNEDFDDDLLRDVVNMID